jgi:predicted branched-subunit amino acid permease
MGPMPPPRPTLRYRITRLRLRAQARMRRPFFRLGARDCLPLALGISAWGLVAGVAMGKSGMGVALAVFMSLLVSAGSSQVAALPLIASGAPMWVVWATVTCVNLRFLVFSYQYRPYFGHLPRRRRVFLSYFMGDTLYAMFLRRFRQERREPGQVDYFWGASLVTWVTWQAAVITGIVAGYAIPPEWGVGFAGTMALLALACSQLRSRSTWVAALVAGCAAVAAYALPLRLNIVVAIAAAVAVGALAQHARPAGTAP